MSSLATISESHCIMDDGERIALPDNSMSEWSDDDGLWLIWSLTEPVIGWFGCRAERSAIVEILSCLEDCCRV